MPEKSTIVSNWLTDALIKLERSYLECETDKQLPRGWLQGAHCEGVCTAVPGDVIRAIKLRGDLRYSCCNDRTIQ